MAESIKQNRNTLNISRKLPPKSHRSPKSPELHKTLNNKINKSPKSNSNWEMV